MHIIMYKYYIYYKQSHNEAVHAELNTFSVLMLNWTLTLLFYYLFCFIIFYGALEEKSPRGFLSA